MTEILVQAVAVITALFGGGAILKLYELWRASKTDSRKAVRDDHEFMRQEYQEWIAKLEKTIDGLQTKYEALLLDHLHTKSHVIVPKKPDDTGEAPVIEAKT